MSRPARPEEPGLAPAPAVLLEMVRTAFDAFNRRDVDGLLALTTPDVVFETVTGRVLDRPEPYVGREGIERYFADIAAVWHTLIVEPVHIRLAGTSVFALGHACLEGPGGSFQDTASWIITLRDDRAVRVQVFGEERLARRALGLPERPPAN
ncbi:MAG TPA: nuclear transport factor 2 family protein [Solirubrobacteraceae bacterium]|jgi:ketosteroid isomerase-like protein|nr:nuclear transport factor 2 family protein [Solirubrobacteraceae bacterium]